MPEEVLVEQRGRTLLVTINRPAARNAIDAAVTRGAASSPLAVAATKEIIVRSADWTSDEAFVKQAEIMKPVFESADAREGAQAFAQKRTPVWRGE
jgi:enoyl-CoA hydratase